MREKERGRRSEGKRKGEKERDVILFVPIEISVKRLTFRLLSLIIISLKDLEELVLFLSPSHGLSLPFL